MRQATVRLQFAAALIASRSTRGADETPQPSPWKDKPVAEWTERDATQVLLNSPWCKKVTTQLLRLQSEDERRAGGNMGRPRGVGYDHIDDTNAMQGPLGKILLKPRSKDGEGAAGDVFVLRWETALPVQAAEMKTHLVEPPTSDGEFFVLAVYGVPGHDFKGDPEKLGEPLKSLAAIKREGKKDIRPVRVEVFERDQDLVVAYLFARTEEITKKDRYLQFEAQIGRFFLQEVFDTAEMHFHGQLEM